MKKLFLCLIVLCPVLLISQTDSTVYRIRLPDSTYTAQLRGVTGSPSDIETIDGLWSTE
ncbi:MAG: hypothetical protein JW860_12235 [Sedimentisphaerales bacterium]|nr:hypothetical protein [Sedimentisphaerales bacterium]